MVIMITTVWLHILFFILTIEQIFLRILQIFLSSILISFFLSSPSHLTLCSSYLFLSSSLIFGSTFEGDEFRTGLLSLGNIYISGMKVFVVKGDTLCIAECLITSLPIRCQYGALVVTMKDVSRHFQMTLGEKRFPMLLKVPGE
jgi:hypothetical protein